jgi:polysaccharide deacetylase family protein (PEP-CTERM system associated)
VNIKEQVTTASERSRASNVFTVDVEDYFQVSGFEGFISRDDWDGFELRVEASTHRMLDLLAKHQVLGVFYVLGWVAERFPEMVRRIHDMGHIVGSHTYWHHMIYNQTPETFAEDLRKSCDILQSIIGKPIQHFRAPSFSMTRKCPWAVEILARQGITYDSSVFPIHHDRCGIPDAPLEDFWLQYGGHRVYEQPMTVLDMGRYRLPISGGGYFRLFPWWFTRWALRRAVTSGQSINFYIHPWEIDPQQPRQTGGSHTNRFRHYVGMRNTSSRLEKLLAAFRFELPKPLETSRTLRLDAAS